MIGEGFERGGLTSPSGARGKIQQDFIRGQIPHHKKRRLKANPSFLMQGFERGGLTIPSHAQEKFQKRLIRGQIPFLLIN
jgi:hypothetical protein